MVPVKSAGRRATARGLTRALSDSAFPCVLWHNSGLMSLAHLAFISRVQR